MIDSADFDKLEYEKIPLSEKEQKEVRKKSEILGIDLSLKPMIKFSDSETLINSNYLSTFQTPKLTRKIFRDHVDEMVKDKTLVRIPLRDKRSKYYSITPLGILHLIKSKEFFDGWKYPHPEREKIILVLQTFAQQNLIYRYGLFGSERFINKNTDLLNDMVKLPGISGEIIAHVFTNVNIEQDYTYSDFPNYDLEIFTTNGFSSDNRIRLDTFNLLQLELTDEKFHHYLANLMIASLIYDSVMLDYDLELSKFSRNKKKSSKLSLDEFKDLPDYIISMLFSVLNHTSKVVQEQYDLTRSFQKELNQLQFL